MNSGIYAILNIANDKYYIGSAIDFADRWRLHRLELNRNNHYNRHLQKAWNKYGENSFLLVVIEYTTELDNREQHWIKELNATDHSLGYNICLFLRNRTGVKASEETRKKLSESHKGYKASDETKRKMSEQRKGNQYNKGRKQTVEQIEKRVSQFRGKERSQETIDKIAASNRGQKRSVETRLKMSIAAKNRRKPLDYTCDVWV